MPHRPVFNHWTLWVNITLIYCIKPNEVRRSTFRFLKKCFPRRGMMEPNTEDCKSFPWVLPRRCHYDLQDQSEMLTWLFRNHTDAYVCVCVCWVLGYRLHCHAGGSRYQDADFEQRRETCALLHAEHQALQKGKRKKVTSRNDIIMLKLPLWKHSNTSINRTWQLTGLLQIRLTLHYFKRCLKTSWNVDFGMYFPINCIWKPACRNLELFWVR